MTKFAGQVPRLTGLSREFLFWLEQVRQGRLKDIRSKRFHGYALSSDPDDPAANSFVMWQSDGTGAGADGDIMVKITDSAGTTKTTTLIDYSAV